MENLIIILVLVLVVGAAGYYIYKAKKNGQKCIGCPHSKSCGSKKCNCSSSEDKN